MPGDCTMSTLKVDTITTRTGSANVTAQTSTSGSSVSTIVLQEIAQ